MQKLTIRREDWHRQCTLALMGLLHREDKGMEGEQLICSASIMQFKNEPCIKLKAFWGKVFYIWILLTVLAHVSRWNGIMGPQCGTWRYHRTSERYVIWVCTQKYIFWKYYWNYRAQTMHGLNWVRRKLYAFQSRSLPLIALLPEWDSYTKM